MSPFYRLRSTPPYLVNPFWPCSIPCNRTILSSTVVLNPKILLAKSVSLCSSTALMHPTKVFPILLASHRILHHFVPTTMFHRVVITRLRMDLTRCCMHFELLLKALSLPSIRPVLCSSHCSMGFFYFYFSCIF